MDAVGGLLYFLTMNLEPMAHGSFDVALRAAIQARGLGLERLRERLLRRGVSVSLATLSYWQSGRSRPERRESMVALEVLEEVLEVPEGALSGLLGPPKPRGRWLRRVAGPEFAAFWPDQERVADAVSEVDTRWDDRLTRLSQHDLVTVGADRTERGVVTRQVLRAECDGPDRWVVVLHLDDPECPPSIVEPVRNCRLGRVINRPTDGLLVAELMFHRPLARGETVITEHALHNQPPFPHATNYERKFRRAVRDYALEISFANPPARCARHTTDADGTETRQVVPVERNGSVHGVALGFGPGGYGFHWEWE